MANSAENEKLKVYEALLCSPGMNDPVKVNFQMSRKDILMLSRVVEAGLKTGEENADVLMALIPKESQEVYESVMKDILAKAGLVDFMEKLNAL